MPKENLCDFEKSPKAYKVKYYSDELCKNLCTAVITSSSVKQASEDAEQIADSEFHILSVKEIGPSYIKKSDIESKL